MEPIEIILDDRGKTHGDFRAVTMCWWQLAQAYRDNYIDQSGTNMTPQLNASITYGLEMILGKLARISAGNTVEIDHWRDIAGYATLVANVIEEQKTTGKEPENDIHTED